MLLSGDRGCLPVMRKTKYILASSAEIVSPGFTPVYTRALDYLFDMGRGPEKFAGAAYGYFNMQSGYMRSATFSVINTGALEELATFVRDNCDFSKPVAVNDIQFFDRAGYRLFCDFGDYYSRLLDTPSQKQQLQSILGRCVIWKAATPSFMEGYSGFVINRHSGLTAYIMQDRYPFLNESYTVLNWYKALVDSNR